MTTTEAEDLKDEFHLRRQAAKRSVTPVTETGLIKSMGREGWSQERQSYSLSSNALEELAACAGIKSEERAAFCAAIDRLVEDFSAGYTAYIARQHKAIPAAYAEGSARKSQPKITTMLRDKAKAISAASEDLLTEIEALRNDEIEHLFGYAYPQAPSTALADYQEWLRLTRSFQRLAEEAQIEVKSAKAPILRELLISCIHILEQFRNEKIERKRRDVENGEHQMIDDFVQTLAHHLPDALKALLMESGGTLEGALREAIEEKKKSEKPVSDSL